MACLRQGSTHVGAIRCSPERSRHLRLRDYSNVINTIRNCNFWALLELTYVSLVFPGRARVCDMRTLHHSAARPVPSSKPKWRCLQTFGNIKLQVQSVGHCARFGLPSSASFRASAISQQRTRSTAQSTIAMAAPEQIASSKMFGGYNRRYKHHSESCGCDMTFSIFFPQGADAAGTKLPILYYLSGLTCTDENVMQKSGVQRDAAAHGIAFIAPDTSPRGIGVEGESDSWDFGIGAGFYLNATQEKWRNWRMYDYITKVLTQTPLSALTS